MPLSTDPESPSLLQPAPAGFLATAGKLLFPRRLGFGLAAVLATAFFIRPPGGWGAADAAVSWLAPVLIIAGFSLRAWASGCAGLHTREGTIRTPVLVTGGPFSHTRNPIYLGTAILGLGVVGVLDDPWLLLPYALALTALYGAIIPAEERHLRERFGEQYQAYCAAVPRVQPRLSSWGGKTAATFRWQGAVGEVPLILIVAFIIVALKSLQALR